MLEAWARLVHRHPWITLLVSGAILAASVGALLAGGTLTNSQPKGTEAGRAFQLYDQELAAQANATFAFIAASPTMKVDDPAFRDALNATIAGLERDPRVASVRSPYDAGGAGLVSKDGREALVIVGLKDSFDRARSYFPEVRGEIRSPSLDITATDGLAIASDFDAILEKDLARAETVSLPLTLVLLLLVFGAVVAALLPLGVGVLAVLGGLGSVMVLARFADVSTYALNIVTLIGLGVAIDYSLFIVNRFREERSRGGSAEDALAKAMATAGRAVVFSGLTVAIGLSGLLFFRGTFLASMGLAGAIVVVFAVAYALSFLPALLALLGPRLDKGSVVPRRWTAVPSERGFWHRLAHAVMRRPVLVLVATLALLLAAGSPFLHVRLASGDVGMLPASAESRRGYETLVSDFPGHDETQILALVHFAEGHPLTSDRVGALVDLSRAIAKLPGVLAVQSVVDLDPSMSKEDYQRALSAPPSTWPPALQAAAKASVGEHVVVLNVLTHAAASSDEARGIVKGIRALYPAQGELLVTGATAFDLDTIAFILQQIPLAVAFVVLVTYALLLVQTGSVLLPLKAVLMNFVSISASFGALVFVFQDGHLAGLLRFSAASIDPTLPVIMFCIMFGLSMDYEVLLLSRMQEELRRSGDNRAAVAAGLEKTGRLITGAAAIMVVVFSAFALAQVTIIKAIGFGLALAVAVDATLVRALLVPATMRLLGRANWWAPGWVKRLQVGVEH